MNYLVNDELQVYVRTPDTYSTFNLSPEWYVICIDPVSETQNELESKCFSGYARKELTDVFQRTDWVTGAEWVEFLQKVWPTLKGKQRLGQAFVNHFHERFANQQLFEETGMYYSDQVNKLYNCTSNDIAQRIIFDYFKY